jgi:hypothetical protein
MAAVARTILGFVAVALIGLSQPAFALCLGKWPNVICISDSGRLWSPKADLRGFSYKPGSPKIARYPNAAAAPAQDATSASSGGTAVTEVLQPSAQTGNAWVLTPQSSGGATVCGSGTPC